MSPAAGYEVLDLHEGSKVENILSNHKDIDLALVDIMLPGRDGFELMELFRKKRYRKCGGIIWKTAVYIKEYDGAILGSCKI